MMEIVYADQWLFAKLSGDATLTSLVGNRIKSYLAPAGTAFPYILYNWQGGTDVMVVGSYRVFNTGLYQVKAVGQGDSMSNIWPVAHRIDEVLHRASGTVTGGIILACVREQPIAYVENSDGIRYNHLGGIYRVLCQKA